MESKLPVASIQNRRGNFVPPTPASTTAAVEALSDALARDARAPIVDPLSYARLPATLQQEDRRLLGELTFNDKTIGPASRSSATSNTAASVSPALRALPQGVTAHLWVDYVIEVLGGESFSGPSLRAAWGGHIAVIGIMDHKQKPPSLFHHHARPH